MNIECVPTANRLSLPLLTYEYTQAPSSSSLAGLVDNADRSHEHFTAGLCSAGVCTQPSRAKLQPVEDLLKAGIIRKQENVENENPEFREIVEIYRCDA